MQLSPMDPEVIGKHTQARKNFMRVLDILEGPEWNALSDAQKKTEVGHLYPERCDIRRKDKIKRPRESVQQRLTTPSCVLFVLRRQR